MRETYWREDFVETCQAIIEDAFLLNALAVYMTTGRGFTRKERAKYFPQVFARLCDYLSQHALDLRHLDKRLGPDTTMKSGP